MHQVPYLCYRLFWPTCWLRHQRGPGYLWFLGFWDNYQFIFDFQVSITHFYARYWVFIPLWDADQFLLGFFVPRQLLQHNAFYSTIHTIVEPVLFVVAFGLRFPQVSSKHFDIWCQVFPFSFSNFIVILQCYSACPSTLLAIFLTLRFDFPVFIFSPVHT